MRMFKFSLLALVLILTATASVVADKPQRIASLNVCTDQLVLAMAERSRIATVTFLARNEDTSYYHKQARGIRINYGTAEEIIGIKPDLIVAGRYTTQATTALLKKLGYRIELFELDDSLQQMQRNMRRMAQLLGETQKGEQLIQAMNRRLNAVSQMTSGAQPVAVIFRANGFTMGRKSLINDILMVAGYRHLSAEMAMDRSGFLPLEKMISADPALIIFGQYKPEHPSVAHQLLQHPALQSLLASRLKGKKRASIVISSNLWNCGGPFIVEAGEKLARKRKALLSAEVSP